MTVGYNSLPDPCSEGVPLALAALQEQRLAAMAKIGTLNRVILVDAVDHYACSKCDYALDVIPDQEGLVAAVATWRVMQPYRLQPRELQLLRKATGLLASGFADKAKVAAASLSRWENGREAMSGQTERTMRLLIASILKEKPHALDWDVSEILQMDLKPFSPRNSDPPCFEYITVREANKKTREWDKACERLVA